MWKLTCLMNPLFLTRYIFLLRSATSIIDLRLLTILTLSLLLVRGIAYVVRILLPKLACTLSRVADLALCTRLITTIIYLPTFLL